MNRNNRKQIGLAAAVAAVIGTSGAFNLPVKANQREGITIPAQKAPAPTEKGQATVGERMLASGYRIRHRKPWPYSGKNRAQRATLTRGFQSF